tara:strand:- start:390 stop:581 length:192 start_codon:yes stop_codon:yes gene_type:complete
MANKEIQVTEGDLSMVLRAKVNTITNLELQIATLSRVLSEQEIRIAELEAGVNGKEPHNAESG